MKCHEIVKHNGIKETLTQLRSEYLIAKGRQVIKSILANCVPYREIIGKACNSPHAPSLPPFRVSDDAAFSQIRVDFAGPLYVRNMYGKKKQSYKSYIVLFSSASTRAIHLELTPDLQETSFLRALKCFIGRRGIPSRILSDNGKTFVDNTVQNYVHSKGIVWRFNIPKASWWGGLFESMVKLTKRCLRKTLKNASLRYEELETVLIETEGILNSRPLTFVYEEITEPPITPSCLVNGRRLLDTVDISKENAISNKSTLTKRARYLKTLLSRMFTQWKREYLTSLREKYQVNASTRQIRKPELGDIVTIHHDKLPRQQWKLGKITRLLPGKDNEIRAVELRTNDKSGKSIVLRRSIKHLNPLEVQERLEKKTINTNENSAEIPIKMVKDEEIPEIIKRV